MTTTPADCAPTEPASLAGPSRGASGVGAPPEPRRPTLSPSRAADFMTCPLRYKFRVIDRLPERPSPPAVRGTLVHAVLEQLFDLPAAQRTPAAAAGLLPRAWAELLAVDPGLADVLAEPPDRGPTDPSGHEGDAPSVDAAESATPALDQWFDRCRDLLDGYFALEDPRRLEPAEREHYVEVLLDDTLVLRGYIDRLDEAPSGELRVVDYKTGRIPSELFEAKALFQMKFYALVLWRSRGVIPRELRLIYLGDRDMLRYAPDEADLVGVERKLRALWAAIERAMATGDWRPRRSKLCDWCEHRELHCPEFPVDPAKKAAYDSWRASLPVPAPDSAEGP